MNEHYQEILSAARAAGKAGREVLLAKWAGRRHVETKARFDYVSDADLAAQEAILNSLFKAFPYSTALAEESAANPPRPDAQSGLVWVVDPLDGTTNYLHHIPHVAVSIAAYLGGQPVAGLVADVTRGEDFYTTAGGGAFLNGEPIKVSQRSGREHWLLATGFPWRKREIIDQYIDLFKELFKGAAGARRAGAAALDMAYVAAGRVEGFFELGLSPWDLAAGELLVREAGGLVTDFSGGPEAVWRGDVAAACPMAHAWLQETCARHFPAG